MCLSVITENQTRSDTEQKFEDSDRDPDSEETTSAQNLGPRGKGELLVVSSSRGGYRCPSVFSNLQCPGVFCWFPVSKWAEQPLRCRRGNVSESWSQPLQIFEPRPRWASPSLILSLLLVPAAGYSRVVLALLSFYLMPCCPWPAVFCYVLSALLDAFDGHAARALNQCTNSWGPGPGSFLSLLGFSIFVSFSYSLRIVFRCSRLTVRFVETTSQPTFKKKVSNHSH